MRLWVTLITIYNPPVNSSYRIECSKICETIDSLVVKIDQYVAQKGKENCLIVNGDIFLQHKLGSPEQQRPQ